MVDNKDKFYIEYKLMEWFHIHESELPFLSEQELIEKISKEFPEFAFDEKKQKS